MSCALVLAAARMSGLLGLAAYHSEEEEEGTQSDTIVGVDDEAPQDGANPCKFSTVLFF